MLLYKGPLFFWHKEGEKHKEQAREGMMPVGRPPDRRWFIFYFRTKRGMGWDGMGGWYRQWQCTTHLAPVEELPRNRTEGHLVSRAYSQSGAPRPIRVSSAGKGNLTKRLPESPVSFIFLVEYPLVLALLV